ncbi:MAB_1171c family putative transporter [Amycolatopsis sp. CA-230715]|uniref:MAB_1171c family putative transporter n=1 Tax=Amycolatopsis sp. CA-230715 TaxID=2745196 RepID=UPI001C030519|nr:MAB_1171c family putative transporter [Amycolatopsis sp. CA-230715]QWF79394.1 hypothetical protein HUW46_02802 [Amycolatopsis sp. CA-230715]
MSTLLNPLNIGAALLFVAALGWRIHLLVRAPRSLPNWAVTITITCVAISFLFQQKAIDDAVDGVLGHGVGRLLNNALLAAGLCALLVFFVGSTVSTRPHRRAAFELLPLAADLVLMVVATALTPVQVRGMSLSPERVHVPGIALFYLGAGLYMIYGLSACVRWMLRYLREADRDLRAGLRLGATGLAFVAAGSVLRALYVVVAWAFGPSWRILLQLGVPLVIVGTALFLAGICYPGLRARIAALARRRRHRREYRELSPLWTLMARSFPTVVLRTGRTRRFDRFRPQHVHRQYYRRVIEIRDGLVQLSPFLGTDLTALAAENPRGAAAELEAALTRRESGEKSDGKAKLVLPGGASDLEADVKPLLALARAVG